MKKILLFTAALLCAASMWADLTPEHENYDASKISVLAVQEGVDTPQDQHSDKLFDGNRATKWCSIKWDTDAYSKRPKDTVVWRTEGFVKMVSYTLTTGDDTQTHPNRNWSSWTLYGGSFESDDDAAAALHNEGAWTIIDNQIQDTVLKAFNDSCFQFACNNPDWYKYYRLVIHDIKFVQGEKQDNIQQMAELTMGVTTFTPPTYETRPSAKAYLKYSGKAQPLINAGSVANGGTVLYKLGNGEWSTDVPQATDSGNYYVYYKIQKTELYPESDPETLITTIYGNKTVPVHDNYPYGGISVLAKQEGVNTNGNQRADRLFNGDADSDNRFNKWCSVTEGITKYEDRPKDIVVWKTADTIKMISYELRIGNDAEDFRNRNWYSWTIYGGSFGSDDAATAALTTEEGWTIIDNQINDTVLNEKNLERYNFVCNNPGTYKYYRLVIHSLHVTDSTAPKGEPGTQQMSELTMGIEHVVPVYQTRPSAKAYLQYTGEKQTLIEPGIPTQAGTILYQLENGKWSTELPQATDSGNYYVYYKIDGSKIAPDTLIATIYGNRTVPEHDNYPYGGISVLAKQEGLTTSADQRAGKLFNGYDKTSITDKWCSVTAGIEKYENRPKDIVVWKTKNAIEMISYELRTGNDATQCPNRNWYSWTIYGGTFANDAEATAAMLNEGAWTIIDNQIKDTVLKEVNDAQYNFACNHPGSYQYYRLVIHSLHVTDSAKNQGVQQMAELTMGTEHIVPVYQTRPSAIANLQYTGANQTLIEPGIPTTGTILYQLKGDKDWSTERPQATDSGNYYVYYKINGSEIAPDTLIATIYGDRTVPEHDDYPYGDITVLTWQEGYSTSNSQHADKLFSPNYSSKWCSVIDGITKYEDRPKDIVVWKTASAIKMISYELQTAYDTKSFPNRNWYSWTIYGGSFNSDDAAKAAITTEEGWTIIDNQIKDTVLKEVNDAQYNFACNNPDTYQYYRLVIHALHVTDSTKNQGVQQMAELTMGIEKATPPTGIEITNDQSPITNTAKFLRDGRLYILRDGKLYNAQGVLVESRK